jgi:xylan 1,4-beta-xylosidase
VGAFLAHTKEADVPVDFASSHVYGNDSSEDVFGTHEKIPRTEMVCRAVKKVHEQILASAYPRLPLIWSEYNADYGNHTEITDSSFMGPYVADTIRQCDGLAEAMSYWAFSDVFEEQGVVKTPFYGGFGLIAERGIPKPAFNGFALLHHLGDTRLEINSDSALVTRRKDGSYAIAVWNMYLPEQTGRPKTIELRFRNLPPGARGARTARVTVVDATHGSPLPEWEKLGRPVSPTIAQIEELRKAAAMPATKAIPVSNGVLTLTLEPQSLALVEIAK